MPDIFDADGMMDVVVLAISEPLDAMAKQQIQTAVRQVVTVTALVPLALVDVVATFITTLRMIRKVLAIYGGRYGFLGSWRLARLVATGAVAVGDDLIAAVAGGSVLSKLSQKFGEGIINNALTARVGVAAMQVCRPFGFHARKPPSVIGIMKHALVGGFT